jgi:hypothetical protein
MISERLFDSEDNVLENIQKEESIVENSQIENLQTENPEEKKKKWVLKRQNSYPMKFGSREEAEKYMVLHPSSYYTLKKEVPYYNHKFDCCCFACVSCPCCDYSKEFKDQCKQNNRERRQFQKQLKRQAEKYKPNQINKTVSKES